jgi:hypothetical protein
VSDLQFRAYEIKYHWREEPPPPEILENLTAKGGDVRKRTLESFNIPGSRETGLLADGVESAEDEQKTPKVGNGTEAEEPGSGGRYPTSKLSPACLTKIHHRLHECFPAVDFQSEGTCTPYYGSCPTLPAASFALFSYIFSSFHF